MHCYDTQCTSHSHHGWLGGFRKGVSSLVVRASVVVDVKKCRATWGCGLERAGGDDRSSSAGMAGTYSVYNGLGWVAAVRFWRGTQGIEFCLSRGEREREREKDGRLQAPETGGRGRTARPTAHWLVVWLGRGALAPPNRWMRAGVSSPLGPDG